MSDKAIRIYIDTNVLINYCTGQQSDVQTLRYIFSQRRKENLFTSSLAIVQTIANLQTKKKTRKAFSRTAAILKLDGIIQKLTVLDLTYDDIKTGFNQSNDDVEDSVHYALSQKAKCDAILTNNISDFAIFYNVMKLSPQMGLSTIKSDIN
jgi:predicted nucleic acid-binding protein